MFQDFKELLSTFNDHKVKYLVVGGYAVSFHVQPRATKDLDILIKADPDNAAAIYAALADFGAPLTGMTPEDFIERGKFYRMGHPPLMVDILPGIVGIDFDQAWQRRIEVMIDAERGLKAFFISRDDLITAKLAAGRHEDLADVDHLRKAAGQITGAKPKPKAARKKQPKP